MILTIALRNLVRHRRRTILSALTIAVGSLIFTFMNSLLTGMDMAAIDNMVHLSTGALKIRTRAYEAEKEAFPLRHGIEDQAGALASALSADPRVKGVTRRTLFLGQLSNGVNPVPVVGTVIDPASDSTVFSLRQSVEGDFFTNDNKREIILGKRLAGDLGVSAGDFITLFALTRYDSRNADEFRIAGLLNTTDPGLNRSGVFVTAAAAEDFLDMEGLATELDVAVKPHLQYSRFLRDVQALDKGLELTHPDLAVSTYLEIGASFFLMSRVKQFFGLVFAGIVLLIAGVGIFNTVFMSVYERMREVGVLRAHGMKPAEVMRLFLLEGVITGMAGSALGLVSGVALNVYLTTIGLPFDKVAGDIETGEFPVWGTIHGVWNLDALLFVFVFGILVASLAAVIPSRRAAQLEVTEALRFV